MLADIVALVQSEWGWLLLGLFFAEQLFNPIWQTRLQVLLDERFAQIQDTLQTIDEKQTAHIQVTRALASKEDNIDSNVVDDYLVENGIDKEEFYVNQPPDGENPPPPADD